MRVKTQERREAIIAEATRLFKETGYERATMSELANRCGGSKATLYGYFASKEELFVAVVRASSTSHLAEAVETLAHRDVHESIENALTRFSKTLLSVLSNDSDALAVYRMVVAEAGRSVVGELFYNAGPKECILALAEMFKIAIDNGELRDTNPYILAQQFLGLLTAETDIRLYQQAPQALDVEHINQMVERAINLFLSGTRP